MKKKDQEILDASYLAKQLRIAPATIDDSNESPDIVWGLEGLTIGLEVTSGASEEYHRAGHLSMKGKTPSLMNVGDLHDRKLRRSNKEISESLSSNSYADRSANKKLWLDRMSHTINKKIEKLNSQHYRLFDRNWLLVFDRQIQFNYDLDACCSKLSERIRFSSTDRFFDRIFIFRYPYFFTYLEGVWTGEEYRNET